MRHFSLTVWLAACLLGSAHAFNAAAGFRATNVSPIRRAVHCNMAEEEQQPATDATKERMDAFVQPPATGPGSPGWVDPR